MRVNLCVCIQVTTLSRDELVSYLQRRSDRFSQGSSKFRGVWRLKGGGKWASSIHHQHKKVHLGLYNTELEAAQAFDRAAVRCKGMKAVTNFDVNEYKHELTEFEDRTRNNHDELQGKLINAEAHNTTERAASEAATAAAAAVVAAETAVDLESTDVACMRPLPLEHAEPELEQPEQAESAKQKQKRRKRENNTDASEAGTSTDPLLTQDNELVRAQTKKGKKSSSSSLQYKGVTQDRTGGWKAQMKDNGRYVYLGTFGTEGHAARAFDLFALKCRGSKAEINFLLEDYTEELAQVIH